MIEGEKMNTRTMNTRTDHAVARRILDAAGVPIGSDFDSLRRTQVESLLLAADQEGYEAPKNANGSRGRYYHERLQRSARRRVPS